MFRVVFFGATSFSAACLDALLELDVTLAGLVTTPTEIRISYSDSPVRIAQHADLATTAAELGIPSIRMTGKMSDHLNEIAALDPDLLVVAGWYHLLPARVRVLAPRGAVGLHASLLPRYRGGAPINWALINGERETGISLFYLDDSVDGGDLIGQARFPIESDDTCATLYRKATHAGCGLIREFVPLLARGAAPRIAQDHAQATTFPQRRPEDGLIDWSWPAPRLFDWVRAQTRPYAGAFTWLDGRRLTIWNATPIEKAVSAEAGTILESHDASVIEVATGEGVLRLLEFEGVEPGAFRPGARLGLSPST